MSGAHFDKAIFTGDARFDNAKFQRDPRPEDGAPLVASFDGATFEGVARFDNAKFQPDPRPDDGATLVASFDGATFEGDAHFDEAVFEVVARFDRKTTFKRDAHFPAATFKGDASFREANFQGDAHFPAVTFDGDATFHKASLKEAFTLGPLLVLDRLQLDGASFDGIEVRVSADKVSCDRTHFHGPANIRIRWAEISLDGAAFESASLLARSEPFESLSAADEAEQRRLEALHKREQRELAPLCKEAGRTDRPRLVSVRSAKVANLVVSDVDMRACRFAGAHNLDHLHTERCTFAGTPSTTWRWRKVWRRLPGRWTRRETLAEEQEWRAVRGHRSRSRVSERHEQNAPARRRLRRTDWYEAECQSPGWLPKTKPDDEPEPPLDIAALYRALRKGREDSKNEPGAADFYYGEMEMRRHGSASRWEHAVIWLYWLVAGYGLRAGRALAALAITIAVGGLLFQLQPFGFDSGKSPDAGPFLFAAESSISLLRAPDTDILTFGGHIVQIVLRLAGPLFFGLAVLSLRGRVKR